MVNGDRSFSLPDLDSLGEEESSPSTPPPGDEFIEDNNPFLDDDEEEEIIPTRRPIVGIASNRENSLNNDEQFFEVEYAGALSGEVPENTELSLNSNINRTSNDGDGGDWRSQLNDYISDDSPEDLSDDENFEDDENSTIDSDESIDSDKIDSFFGDDFILEEEKSGTESLQDSHDDFVLEDEGNEEPPNYFIDIDKDDSDNESHGNINGSHDDMGGDDDFSIDEDDFILDDEDIELQDDGGNENKSGKVKDTQSHMVDNELMDDSDFDDDEDESRKSDDDDIVEHNNEVDEAGATPVSNKESLKDKFNRTKQQILSELKGGSGDEESSSDNDGEDDPDDEENSDEGGRRLPKPVAIIVNPIRNTYGKLVTIVLNFIIKILGYLGKIPVIGKFFDKLANLERPLRIFVNVLPIILLAMLAFHMNSGAVPSMTSSSQPDNGDLVISNVSYDSSHKIVKAEIKNSGDIILNGDVRFKVYSTSIIHPMSWFSPRVVGQCKSGQFNLDADNSIKITANCSGDLSGFGKRALGSFESSQ